MDPSTPTKQSESIKPGDIVTLCHLIMSATEFKPDHNKAGEAMGLSHGKNVARKINIIVNPHGFEYKGGKIVLKSDDATPQTQAASSSTHDTPDATSSKKRKLAKDE